MKSHQGEAGPAARADATATAEAEAGGRALARVLIRCVAPLLGSESPENAQSVLNAIALLVPYCDTRRLHGLAHFRVGEYMEAMDCWSAFDDLESRALCTLCLRAIGEASWWGAAQAIYESGDPDAMAVLAPWMADPAAPTPLSIVAGPAVADDLVENVAFAFRPLRA